MSYNISILSIAFTLSSLFSLSQSFEWITNDTILLEINANAYSESDFYIENVSMTSVNPGLEVVYNDLPIAWDGSMCIEELCYYGIPQIGYMTTMVPLSSLTTSYIKLTLQPMGIIGGGTIRVRVYNLDDPTDSDTCTWIVNSVSTLSLVEKNSPAAQIYPNPSIDKYIHIESSIAFNQVEIYSMDGRKVSTRNFTDVKSVELEIPNLRPGNYFINLNGNRTQIQRLKLSIK